MIRAGIAGFGWWGRTIAAYLRDSQAIGVTRVAEPTPALRDEAAAAGLTASARFEDLLEANDIDAVILCTPHRFHAAQIVAAADAGKHVFCEKPLCTSAAEVDAAIAAVQCAGVRLAVGHERRFEPAVVEMRQRIGAGEFGTLLAMEGNFSQDKFLTMAPDNWRLSKTEAPAGPLSATGIHLVDLSVALFGRPKEVWARLATRATGFENGDTLTITLGFDGGETALITAILTTPFFGRFCVFGSHGWFDIRDRTHPEAPTGWDVATCLRGGAAQRQFYEPYPAVKANLEAFAAAAAGGPAYPVSLEEMRANVHAYDAIQRSVLSGKIEVV